MQFLLFLWNCFSRFVGFISFLFIEIAVFAFIFEAVRESAAPWLAWFVLLPVFIVWFLCEIVIRITSTGTSFIRYLFERLFGRF